MVEINKQRLGSLQVGRALAAFAVVCHHAALSVRDLIGPLPAAFQTVLEFGWFGVDFFFVLSGFIIYHATYRLPPSWRTAKDYCVNRIVRVYTPYIPVSICVIALYTFIGSNNDRDWSIITSMTLLPLSKPPALSVAWTLQHELVFYAIFALGFFSRRLSIVLITWCCAIGIFAVLGIGKAAPYSHVFSLVNIEFMFGMFAAIIFTREKLRSSQWPYLIAAASLLTWGIAFHFERNASAIGGIAIAALILPIVNRDQKYSTRYGKVTLLLGSASYAVYLVHNPLLSVTTRLVGNTHLPARGWVALAVGALASIVLGIAYHLAFEVPATRMIRNSIKCRSQTESVKT